MKEQSDTTMDYIVSAPNNQTKESAKTSSQGSVSNSKINRLDYIPNPNFESSAKSKGKTNSKSILKFSSIEITHLFWGWLAISIAFANILKNSTTNFYQAFLISAIAVGLGFILHEIGHKYVAQRYGMWAEFRAQYFMLFFAVIISLFGIVIAAPGAVMIYGRASKKQNGIISVAGPAINLVLAVLFLALSFLFGSNEFVAQLSFYGFMINSWIALFNLIPFSIFDGKKIFDWNKAIWGLMVAVSCIFLFMQTFLFSI